ncbi:hypothetical protein IIA15_08060 [candidate division TA06 bacterium]|nr:hypothetical protein [candidate division TA06 bacterium]
MSYRLWLIVKFGLLTIIVSGVLIFWMRSQEGGAEDGNGDGDPLRAERLLRGETLAKTLAYYNLDPLLFDDEIAIQVNLTKAKEEIPDVHYVAIVGEDGKTIARDGEDPPEGLNPLKNEEKLIQEASTKEGKQVFDIRVPIKVGGKKKAEVHLGILAPEVSSTPAEKGSLTIPLLLMALGVIGVLLLALTSRLPKEVLDHGNLEALKEEEEELAIKVSQLKQDKATHNELIETLKREEAGLQNQLIEARKTERELAKKLEETKKAKPPEAALSKPVEALRREMASLTQWVEEKKREKETLLRDIMEKTGNLKSLSTQEGEPVAAQRVEAKQNEELAITQRIVAKRREEIALSQRLEIKKKEALDLTRKLDTLKEKK